VKDDENIKNNMTTTSYIPKKIIKKDPQKINEAFKTRPEIIKLLEETKIIRNDSKTEINISCYSQSRTFHNENLKRKALKNLKETSDSPVERRKKYEKQN